MWWYYSDTDKINRNSNSPQKFYALLTSNFHCLIHFLYNVANKILTILLGLIENSIKITQNNVIFCYFVKFYSYCGKFQPSYETKKSMENDNEANPERSGYDG